MISGHGVDMRLRHHFTPADFNPTVTALVQRKDSNGYKYGEMPYVKPAVLLKFPKKICNFIWLHSNFDHR